MFSFPQSSEVRAIRRAISHPIVDGDSHVLELLPFIHEIAQELSDTDTADAMLRLLCDRSTRLNSVSLADRRSAGIWRGSWWGVPAENTLDRATTTLPRLLHNRLEQFGIDFQLIYPTLGLLVFLVQDQDIRNLMARSFNTYYARMFDGVRDRIEPAAVIPMHTPAEAINELRYAVETLSFRTVVMTGVVPRQIIGSGVPGATWTDTVAYGSDYDYDPVWVECERLGVVPTFHGTGMGWGSRTSPKNYVYNHLGNFAAANEACCRAIVMGGAARRFPQLSWCFLEGGVSWAAQLQADLIEHFEKRGPESISQYDPGRVDWPLMANLYKEYRSPHMADRDDIFTSRTPYLADPADGRPLLNDFAESGLTSRDDITDLFKRFYFGCEPDDRLIPLSFDRQINPGDSPLRPVFASDIGHWDVSDARQVLPEIWRLRRECGIGDTDFKALTFTNIVECLTRANSSFFERTTIANEARLLSRHG
ncbi:amidohydrolase family protein [Streptacidiphilus sp. N1-12]|uniref:Amidohydrolase family protein n=2 Tax=Streptacidiphilus alkalitolerans TaxID=3342712 RepID=A0ABV6VEX7_9ACTN